MSRVVVCREQQAAVWQATRQHWHGARAAWRDAAAAAFEQQYWNEWDRLMPRFLNALDLLNEAIDRAMRHSQE